MALQTPSGPVPHSARGCRTNRQRPHSSTPISPRLLFSSSIPAHRIPVPLRSSCKKVKDCETTTGHLGPVSYTHLDVYKRQVFGRCEATTGIAPFERLVDQVMSQPPYDTARRVFWVMDNGSSHRGEASVRRLTNAHPRVVPVHGPVHASWLNQIEIYFSIVQRKALTPNDFPCLEAVAERLTNFERYFERIAHPFEWKFTRADLNALIARMRNRWAQNQHLKMAA